MSSFIKLITITVFDNFKKATGNLKELKETGTNGERHIIYHYNQSYRIDEKKLFEKCIFSISINFLRFFQLHFEILEKIFTKNKLII